MHKIILFFAVLFTACQTTPAPRLAAPSAVPLSVNLAELEAVLAKYATRPARKDFALFIKIFAAQAVALERKTGVPAPLQIAAALLETGGGKSDISKATSNLFNIKARQAEIAKGEFYRCGRGVKWAKHGNPAHSFAEFCRVVSGYQLSEHTPESLAFSPYLAGASRAERAKYARDLRKIMQDYNLLKIFI